MMVTHMIANPVPPMNAASCHEFFCCIGAKIAPNVPADWSTGDGDVDSDGETDTDGETDGDREGDHNDDREGLGELDMDAEDDVVTEEDGEWEGEMVPETDAVTDEDTDGEGEGVDDGAHAVTFKSKFVAEITSFVRTT